MVTTDLLPLIAMGIAFGFHDNSTEQLLVWMWLNLIFLFTVPPRLIFYAGFTSRRRWVQALGVGVALVSILLGIWGTTHGRTHLRVEEIEVTSSRIPSGWDNRRIVLFSDLHIGTLLQPAKEVSRLVDTLLGLHPDLILFAGDLVNIRHTELDESVARHLTRLKAPLGVYTITGNHDVGVYIKDSLHLSIEENTRRLIEQERALGWNVLDNESCLLLSHGDTISLTGISFDPSLRNFRHGLQLPEMDILPAYQGIDSTHFNITLCHLPQLWDLIRSTPFGDLTFSGHVHSMQHKIPVGERGWSLASLLYPRWSGRYDEAGKSLYINDGIGSVGIPTRLGAYPEITLIHLHSEE